MERTKCQKCGRVGYTASPDQAACDHCSASYRDLRLSYQIAISAASIYTGNDGILKMKINVMLSMLLNDRDIFFVTNLTFCSLNEVETFDYTGLLRKKREDLFKYTSPILTNEAAYLYIRDKRPHGGVS